ncbi:MAG TPA: ATP-binding protein, partial [Thermoanaerobaculia bacterium]|nr:ATP-binding protein [Thermoanaerobaculia bacterium]
MSDSSDDWTGANQRHLAAAVGVVRARFAAAAGQQEADDRLGTALAELEAARAALPSPSALDLLVETFDLSPFERELLLAAAGVELDAGFAAEVAPVTFGRALAVLDEAHWSALSPGGALRRWRLIEIGSGPSLTDSPLRIDERILHHLAGVAYLDDRLAGYLDPVAEHELVPSHQRLAGELAAVWARAGSPLPILHLTGGDAAVRRGVAASASAALGLGLHAMPAALLPLAADELNGLVRLWERESVLTQTALVVEVDELTVGDAAREAVLARLLDTVRGPLFLSGGERRAPQHRPIVAFAVEAPTSDEQRALWHQVLAGSAADLNGQVDDLVGHFRLSPAALRTAGARALATTDGDDAEAGNDLAARLWSAAREQARPRLEGLAQRLEPSSGWDDLVLPPAERATLAELAVQVRRR